MTGATPSIHRRSRPSSAGARRRHSRPASRRRCTGISTTRPGGGRCGPRSTAASASASSTASRHDRQAARHPDRRQRPGRDQPCTCAAAGRLRSDSAGPAEIRPRPESRRWPPRSSTRARRSSSMRPPTPPSTGPRTSPSSPGRSIAMPPARLPPPPRAPAPRSSISRPTTYSTDRKAHPMSRPMPPGRKASTAPRSSPARRLSRPPIRGT